MSGSASPQVETLIAIHYAGADCARTPTAQVRALLCGFAAILDMTRDAEPKLRSTLTQER